MANFAKIEENTVQQVIVIATANLDGLIFPASEPIGQAFIASLGLEGQWLQTSYTGVYRGCYAGIGYTFDAFLGEYGEFVPPQAPAVE
jgi:hypothetical protein